MTLGPACQWTNDSAISALNLSSTYQTQSGLDLAISTNGYQKASDVSASITSALGSSGFQSSSQVSSAITSALNSSGFELNAHLDADVLGFGYVKTAGANSTNVHNLGVALGYFISVFSAAASITDPNTSLPFDFSALNSALSAL
ncbi:MAG: hypothetical protein P4L31_04965 [Candidatus Babeliales bacterium]|nr:hypothetical protein [Candidatus Babeliales bacterium]